MRLVMLILRRDGGLLSWFGGVGWNCVYNVLPVGRAVGSLLVLNVVVDDEWRDRGSGIGYIMVYLEGTRIFCKQDGSMLHLQFCIVLVLEHAMIHYTR